MKFGVGQPVRRHEDLRLLPGPWVYRLSSWSFDLNGETNRVRKKQSSDHRR